MIKKINQARPFLGHFPSSIFDVLSRREIGKNSAVTPVLETKTLQGYVLNDRNQLILCEHFTFNQFLNIHWTFWVDSSNSFFKVWYGMAQLQNSTKPIRGPKVRANIRYEHP